MIYKNEDITIKTDFDNSSDIISDAIYLYKCFNKKQFPEKLEKVNDIFSDIITVLYDAFNNKPIKEFNLIQKPNNDNKVVVCFSGGLDSVYQSLYLREIGYNVILFHVANMNKYTNGQELKIVKKFADILNFPLEIVEMKASRNSKEFPENPFKNTLLFAIAYEYMKINGIQNLSCGEEFNLLVKDSVKEYNIADTKECMLSFTNKLDANFIPISENVSKVQRMDYLYKNKTLDYSYSCVGGGRFNKSLHNKNQEKFGIELEKYNCGSCRKCCLQSLFDHYILKYHSYPNKYIKHCWDKVGNGSDSPSFGKHLSIEKRIENLKVF